MSRRTLFGIVAVAAVVLAVGATRAVQGLADTRGNAVPTAVVTKGPLNLTVFATGDLRAGRTMMMPVPPVGGMVRIVQLVTTGLPVKAGDTLVEFDPTDQQFALDQAKTEVAEAEQEIVKMKADATVQVAQDQVALLTARFDVRRAELDVSGNEFVGAVEAQKNVLSLEEARRRLAQLEEDVKSRSETNKASLAVVLEKRNKATLARQRAEQVIDSLALRAPMDGVAIVKENRNALGGIMFGGMSMPEFRTGDSVSSGAQVVEVIEGGRMELRARVNEVDRANLTQGQLAIVEIDTLPGQTFKARVGELSAQARRGQFFESSSTSRQFDVAFEFEQPDPRMRAGASARVQIEGKALADALTLPRQAVFQKSGRTHVFVKNGDRFEQREVKVVERNESRAALDGLAEGAEVALVDPNANPTAGPASSSPSLPSGSGR